MNLASIQIKSDSDCGFCLKQRKVINRETDAFCLDCGVLFEMPKPDPITYKNKCLKCNGTGQIVEEKMQQICCENFLEIGLCCQYYKMDIAERPYKCEACDSTGKRKDYEQADQK